MIKIQNLFINITVFVFYSFVTIASEQNNNELNKTKQLIAFAHANKIKEFIELEPNPIHLQLFGWEGELKNEEMLAGYKGEAKKDSTKDLTGPWHKIFEDPHTLEIILASSIPNRCNRYGIGLLNAACRENQINVVERLLALPTCDPNIYDTKGKAPLHDVIECKDKVNILKLLLNHPKIDLNILTKKNNIPAWKLALESDNFEAIELLIKDKRTDLSILDDWDRTLYYKIYERIQFYHEWRPDHINIIQKLKSIEEQLLNDERTNPNKRNKYG